MSAQAINELIADQTLALVMSWLPSLPPDQRLATVLGSSSTYCVLYLSRLLFVLTYTVAIGAVGGKESLIAKPTTVVEQIPCEYVVYRVCLQ